MNVSSIVIQVLPKNYDLLQETFEKSDICDFHFGDKEVGKMIVTIDGENVDEEITKLVKIQNTSGVITADMMQTYQEDLDEAIKELENSASVPEVLNNENINIRDIQYNGDLKKKDFKGGV